MYHGSLRSYLADASKMHFAHVALKKSLLARFPSEQNNCLE